MSKSKGSSIEGSNFEMSSAAAVAMANATTHGPTTAIFFPVSSV